MPTQEETDSYRKLPDTPGKRYADKVICQKCFPEHCAAVDAQE